MTGLLPISARIWDMKYRLKCASGEPVENSVEETWDRVASAVAKAESAPEQWAPQFRAAMVNHRFLPAGRLLAGAGSGRAVTLFNCFVMGTIPDSIDGIFDHLKEAALTLQQGGGIGYDFSTLRPRGSLVHGVAAQASGPVSFMEVWDAMCRTIQSAGARRGAMMGCLRCDHPDIEDFIDAKRTAGRLTMFNLSVLVRDAFLTAVDEDAAWPLRFGGQTVRTTGARQLWERLMQATYDVAEPGVIFIDRVNRHNPLAYCETITATNPCGEQPLPPYGACLLGALNLAAFVRDPFAASASLDEADLLATTATAVRFLDDAIEVSNFPLPAQRSEARAKRRLGLGVTGLADALVMLGLRYGSPQAVEWTESVLGAVRLAAVRASVDLAVEKGPFPLFDRDAFLAGAGVRGLPAGLVADIARQGIRNAVLMSIAPTGTTSLLAGNVSSGIEPIYDLVARRRIVGPDGAIHEEIATDHAYALFRALRGDQAPLPDAFVTVADLVPQDHLVMQAAAQRHVDAAISKTVNVPRSISFAAFKEIYRTAWAMGCKGCTTYRPNSIRGAVLSSDADPTVRSDGSCPDCW